MHPSCLINPAFSNLNELLAFFFVSKSKTDGTFLVEETAEKTNLQGFEVSPLSATRTSTCPVKRTNRLALARGAGASYPTTKCSKKIPGVLSKE